MPPPAPSGGRNPVSTEVPIPNPEFWRGRRVFVTGHTGFKGGWLCLWLQMMGAQVTGYALPPRRSPTCSAAARLAAACAPTRATCATSGPCSGDRRSPARGGPPPRGAVARAPVATSSRSRPSRPTSWARSTCSRRSGAGGSVRVDRGRHQRQVLREPRVGLGLPRERPARRARPLSAQQGLRRAGRRGLPRVLLRRAAEASGSRGDRARRQRHRRRRLGARTGSCPTPCAPSDRRRRRWRCATRRRSGPGSTCSSRCRGYLMLAERLPRSGSELAEAWNFGPARGRRAAGRLGRRAPARGLGRADRLAGPQRGGRSRTRRVYLALDASKAKARLGWRPRLALERDARLDRPTGTGGVREGADVRALTERADRAGTRRLA